MDLMFIEFLLCARCFSKHIYGLYSPHFIVEDRYPGNLKKKKIQRLTIPGYYSLAKPSSLDGINVSDPKFNAFRLIFYHGIM